MLSSDCPYKCNVDNEVLDPARGRMVPCPHCREVATKQVAEQEYSVAEKLGFKNQPYLSPTLNKSQLVPEYELSYTVSGSYDKLFNDLKTLWGKLSQGELPRRSVCYGLGMKGRITRTAFALLHAAYSSGMNVHPLITGHELRNWDYYSPEELSDAVNSKVVVVLLEEGITREGLRVAKGFMQSRASRGYPTIFITTCTINTLNTLVDSDELAGLEYAEPHFLEYPTTDQNKYSKFVMGILGDKNEMSEE